MSGTNGQQPAEALAAEEQHRADGIGRRLGEISSNPGHPSRGSLPHYQHAYREASAAAARHTAQPGGDR